MAHGHAGRAERAVRGRVAWDVEDPEGVQGNVKARGAARAVDENGGARDRTAGGECRPDARTKCPSRSAPASRKMTSTSSGARVFMHDYSARIGSPSPR